ncbi:unnamed protein product, partial [marine sediment metagenome]
IMGVYTMTETTEDFSIDYVSKTIVEYGDVLRVIGSDITAGSTVNVYWDFVTAANLLNVTTGLSSGNFDCEVEVPSAEYGSHYIWAKDLATGATTSYEVPILVMPKIKLSPASGLKNDDITIKGYGFSEDSEITFDYDGLSEDESKDETDELGYFEYTFEVDTDVYTTYDVKATDENGYNAKATFTLGAAITLDKEVGPAGTIVKVEGRGFTEGTVIVTEVGITLDGTYPVSTKDGEDIDVSSTGTFTAYVVIPSVEIGDYEITILDVAAPIMAEFEVDGETSITVTPEYG